MNLDLEVFKGILLKIAQASPTEGMILIYPDPTQDVILATIREHARVLFDHGFILGSENSSLDDFTIVDARLSINGSKLLAELMNPKGEHKIKDALKIFGKDVLLPIGISVIATALTN